jgi:hypothetical protein
MECNFYRSPLCLLPGLTRDLPPLNEHTVMVTSTFLAQFHGEGGARGTAARLPRLTVLLALWYLGMLASCVAGSRTGSMDDVGGGAVQTIDQVVKGITASRL